MVGELVREKGKEQIMQAIGKTLALFKTNKQTKRALAEIRHRNDGLGLHFARICPLAMLKRKQEEQLEALQ